MASHVVARVDELTPGSRKLVEIGGRSIGVFNIGGEYFALRNRCPHQGGPLCEGFVVGRLSAEQPGRYDHRPDVAYLRCPWHGWEFDVRTGQSWFDPARTRVRTYDVGLRAGADVEDAADAETAVTNEPTGAGSGAAETSEPAARVPGPHVAETYRASVRDEYVVVEVGAART